MITFMYICKHIEKQLRGCARSKYVKRYLVRQRLEEHVLLSRPDLIKHGMS